MSTAQAYTTYKLGGKLSEMLYSPATYGVDFSGKNLPRPKARANGNLAVAGNTLWLMGGIVEVPSPLTREPCACRQALRLNHCLHCRVVEHAR